MAQTRTGRFANMVPAELICARCTFVAYPPVIVCRAAHLLCEPCRDLGGRHCPVCKGGLLQTPQRSRAAVLKLDEYIFHCRNEDVGCPWQGQVSKEEHHALMLCGFRSLVCLECGQSYHANQWRQHEGVCPGAMIVCPEGGRDCLGPPSSGVYRRRDTEKHVSQPYT
ncbi:hypothetical protein JCM3770_003718 [Rhodotorula araucariae]